MGFNISIMAGGTPESSVVQASGDDWHAVTDIERDAFGLSDDAIRAYFKADGIQASDVYVKGDPQAGPYDCRLWKPGECPPQVQVHLIAAGAKITGFSLRPDIIATKLFENDSSITGTTSGGVSTTVTNTITNSWSQSNSLTVGTEIGFNAGVVSGKVSFSFKHDWNWGGSETQSIGVGSTDNVSVVLNPHQKVEAELQMARGTLTAEISYVAVLGGDVVAASGEGYISGYAADAAPVKSLTITQTLTFDFFSMDTVKLVDPSSGTLLNAGPRRSLALT